MNRFGENRRIILIILIAVLLVCLLGVLAYNVFIAGGGQSVVGGIPPTATSVLTEEPEAAVTPEEEEEMTPTPTRVISGEVTEEATSEPTEEMPVVPTETPTPQPTPSTPVAITPSVIEVVEVGRVDEILKNGGFEEGFDERGVGVNWQTFQTGSANFAFSQETAELFVFEGDSAQRISVEFATEADRHGGIYQTVEVVPGEVYTLTLHGQIRSGFGDITKSSYGYRMQYAVDYTGNTNWRDVPTAEWVELPWDEQLLAGSAFQFNEYTTHITPTAEMMTLFVRTWNKWAIPTLAEYTLDGLSLVGPVPGEMILVSTETGAGTITGSGTVTGTTTTTGTTTAGGEGLVDGGLPTTGIASPTALMQDGRFWGGVLILVLLGIGAIYRGKWGW